MKTISALLRSWRARRRGWREGDLEERFTRIWAENRWRSPETRSGKGSSLERTRGVRAALPELLRRLGARSLLDVPCGDFHWMREAELDLDSYVGADIVRPLIEANRERFGTEGRTFLHLDFTREALPAADLVLCRDGLIHLSFADAARAVERLCASGSRHLLTTTFRLLERNADKPSGRSRLLNLERAPFRWPPPLEIIEEDRTDPRNERFGKCLGLWRIAELPRAPGAREPTGPPG